MFQTYRLFRDVKNAEPFDVGTSWSDDYQYGILLQLSVKLRRGYSPANQDGHRKSGRRLFLLRLRLLLRLGSLSPLSVTTLLADMLEDDGALAAEMLVQGNSIGRASQVASEPMLAVLYWRPSQIFAVDLKKVEGTQDYARVVAMAPDQLEHGEALVVAGDGLAIDQARAPRKRCHGRRGKRKPLGEVISVAGNKPDTGAVAPGHDPKPVVLDLIRRS